MTIHIVFETHSISEDNERGIASGWLPGRLSARGRLLARELGLRRISDGYQAVFTSDLARAVETAEIAFAETEITILHDWRLRECDYGDWNGMPKAEMERTRQQHLDQPYPHGESWRQAIQRTGRFLDDLPLRWQNTRVMVIGHMATRWALEHIINGVSLEELANTNFIWQPGWEYHL